MKPYLRVANVFENRIDSSDVKTMHFEPEAFERSKLRPGDVLLNEGQSPEWLGRPAIYRGEPPDVAFTNSLIRFRPNSAVTSEWALTVFRHHMHAGRFARESRITTNIAHLSLNRLAGVEFRVPPRAEQERIIVALDEAFSKVDAGEVGLRTARRLLKRMRNAILAAAVTGGLVPQDPTDAPASKLLADVGVEPVEQDDSLLLPESWVLARLDALAGVHDCEHRTPKFIASGIPAFRPRDVAGGSLDLAGAAKVSEDEYQRQSRRYALRRGDIVYSRELSLGWAAVLGSEPGCLSQGMVAISPLSIAAGYLVLYLNGLGRQVAVASQAGSAHPHLNLRDIRAFAVPLPPREEQTRIVAEVDRQISFIAACERAVDAGSAQSAALRRSVLQAAFQGLLVPQDSTDEPASVSLERIRDERAATPKAKSRRAGAKA